MIWIEYLLIPIDHGGELPNRGDLMMKKLLLSGVALAALAVTPVLAADLGRPVYKAPPPAPAPLVYNWGGWYVGLNAGGHWFNDDSVDISSSSGDFAPGQPNADIFASNFAALATGPFGTGHNGSFIGGGQLGYNWEFGGAWVAGFETDIQGVSHNNDASTTSSSLVDAVGNTIDGTVSVDRSLDYLGTVRGRLGYLATPTLLAYATGGLAYGHVKSSACISELASAGPDAHLLGGASTCGDFSETRAGWTVGGGLEWMFAPHWSLKAEYLFYDLGHVDYSAGAIAPVLIPPAVDAGSPLFVNSMQARTHFDGSIARGGINYHF